MGKYRHRTNEEKTRTSEQMTARWKLMRRLAEILGTSLDQTNRAHGELKKKGLIDWILANDGAKISEARDLIAVRQPSPLDPVDYPFPPASCSTRLSSNSDFKIMLWAVRKIGRNDVARDAFERVIRALEHP